MARNRRAPTAVASGERDSDLRYVLQGGALKGLGLVWRNATYRSAFSRDIDENRLYLTYELPLF